MELAWVQVDRCEPNSYNPNVMDAERFEALCDFMRGHGAEEVDPIWVRKNMQSLGKYEIVDGEHRWKAAKEVGWSKLRAFLLDIREDDAKAFNVRKNRERGKLDTLKLAEIIANEKGTSKEIAKKYGFPNGSGDVRVRELRQIHENREAILGVMRTTDVHRPISLRKTKEILRELKNPEQPKDVEEDKAEDLVKLPEPQPKSEEIVKEMVKEIVPAIKSAFANVPPENPHDPERNKLVLNMLLKNLQQGLLFCPVCGQRMMECSHCHTSLEKMKEAQKL